MWQRLLGREARKPLLLFCLAVQLSGAFFLRWPLTKSTIKTSIEYLLGQEVIASENWRRDGALARHFVPSRSIDQNLPEWAYRDNYWRDYVSQPPLSFMLEYWGSRALDDVDPVLIGKLLAHALIATGILLSAWWLHEVFDFGAALAGLSFLVWGQPFLVWFIDGYYATTPAMVCQLVLVSWSLVLFRRQLASSDDQRHWRGWPRDLLIVAAFAYLGTFSEWIALFGNAVAAAAFLVIGIALHARRARRAWQAYAVSAAIIVGSSLAELTTVLLFGTKVGFAFYWAGFMDRVETRTGQGTFLEYTKTLFRQMDTAWPHAMLIALEGMTAIVFVVACAQLLKRGRRRSGALLALALVLGFGGPVTYCYRLKNLVEIHWWFTGTWAIGWAMTICSFTFVVEEAVRRVVPRRRITFACAAAVATVWAGAAVWNLWFVDLRVHHDRVSKDFYRALGAALPLDGYPLVVADMPDLFGDYPFTTAYLRRPVLRYNAPAVPLVLPTGLLTKLGTTEDAFPTLLEHYAFADDFLYVVYNPMLHECAYQNVDLGQWNDPTWVRVCRVRTTWLLRSPNTLWLAPQAQVVILQ